MAESSFLLVDGELELELSPAVGGAIANFTWIAGGGREPILRAGGAPLHKALDAACFPLVPFVNRIRCGEFDFRGRHIQLSPNMAGDPNPLHGQGWTSAWSVESRSATDAVLGFEHEAGEWPWIYQARQHFRLAADSLHLKLTCRNTSAEPMPCGLGFHPYFHCGAGTRIETDVAQVWTVDEQVLPVARMAAAGRYSIADDPVCGRDLDNGYDGWSGRTLLTDPDWPFDLELSSPGARFFQLYSPAGGGIFVAEPVTHANAALNRPEADWPALGIRILEPDEEIALEARIAVRDKRSPLG